MHNSLQTTIVNEPNSSLPEPRCNTDLRCTESQLCLIYKTTDNITHYKYLYKLKINAVDISAGRQAPSDDFHYRSYH